MTRLRLHLATALLALLGIGPTCLSQTYSPLPTEPTAQTSRYDRELAGIEEAFASLSAPEQAVALARAYGLREYVGSASGLTSFFDRIAADASNPLVGQAALRYSALMRLHAGDLDAAQHIWGELGLIRNWRVLGPFPGDGPAAGQVDPTASYTEGGVMRSWRQAPAIGPRGTLELSHLFPGTASGTIAVAAVIPSDGESDAVLRFGAASAAEVFLNGEKVFAGPESVFAFDQHSVAIHLHSGSNRIVVALHRSGTAGIEPATEWQFTARVTTTGADDLLAQQERAAEAATPTADALDTLAVLQQLHGSAAAHDTYERAALMTPTAQRWLHVASSCSAATCVYTALRAAHTANANDPDVLLAFARYYASRHQDDDADRYLQLAQAAAPDDYVPAALLADAMARQGRRVEALRALRSLALRFSGTPWLERQTAAGYERLGMLDLAVKQYAATLTSDFDDPQLRRALQQLDIRRGDSQALRALYADSLRLDPSDTQAMSDLARLDAGAGKTQAATDELHAALAIAPGDLRLQEQLADSLALAGQPAAADAQLNAAISAHPANDHLIRRAKLEGDRVLPADPETKYMADAAALADQAQRIVPTDRADAVELADVRVVRLAEDGRSTVRAQQVVYIADEQGARDYETRTLSYSPHSQSFQLVHARVFKANGSVLPADDLGDSGPSDGPASMYYDTRSRTLRYPELAPGDVIELDYRLLPKDNPYGDYFGELETFGSSLPRKLQRYVVIAPESRPLHITAERLPHADETHTATEVVYAWQMRNLAPLPAEPHQPATTEIAPYVDVSTMDSWAQVGRWYARLIDPQLTLDATLREVLAGVIAGKNTDQEKIRAIHQFVLRNTHYVALEFGIYNYKPYPVSEVYARRFGDCKDKSSLMIALLRAAGIDAELALVRTRHLGDVSPDATSLAVFNHAVVYIPKYDLWLDGTAEYAGSHELPIDDQGAQALTVSFNGQAQFRRIPVTLPMENYTHRQVLAQLQPDGSIDFTGSAYTRGEDAPGLRRDYEVTELQRTSFRNRLAEVLPAVQLKTVEVNGAHDLESDVVVNFSGDLDTYKGDQQVSLSPSWMKRAYVQKLAALASRTEPLVLPAPWTTEEELHFQLPAGARIESLPQNTNLQTQFGEAIVRYERQGDQIVVKTFVQFSKLHIGVEEYPAFREFCSQVQQAFQERIKVGL